MDTRLCHPTCAVTRQKMLFVSFNYVGQINFSVGGITSITTSLVSRFLFPSLLKEALSNKMCLDGNEERDRSRVVILISKRGRGNKSSACILILLLHLLFSWDLHEERKAITNANNVQGSRTRPDVKRIGMKRESKERGECPRRVIGASLFSLIKLITYLLSLVPV